jgi:hypothetical protein
MNLHNSIDNFIQDGKLEIKKGYNRNVFLFPNNQFVLKIPLNNSGSDHNFAEWIFWQNSQSEQKDFLEFLQPTLFLFKYTKNKEMIFWANIQQMGFRPCTINPEDFTYQMQAITNFEVIYDQHHFYNPENFFWDENGKLKMIDYGGAVTQQIIMKYGKKIHEEFDGGRVFSEEEKEKMVKELMEKL